MTAVLITSNLGEQTESDVQNRKRLDAASNGSVLWRNNSGALHTKDGRFVRFGLANESEQENKNVKSSDLIGISKITITANMIGKTLGVFTAIECKRPDWKRNHNNRHENAQAKFLDIVSEYGGIAYFYTVTK